MRKLYFLLPGTKGKFGGGGLWAELNTYNLAKQFSEAEVVTYRQRESEHLFLADLLPECQPESAIFVIGWGFDVPKLIPQLQGQNIIYHAHSAGYGFSLPPQIPIITVSRNTMGYWGQQATNNLIYYLPNQIGDEFRHLDRQRSIDILVQTRKSSEYLLDSLIPALQSRYRVEIINSYVEDLAGLFNRSKIYLYDSAEYWAVNGVTEGFGLPPLEALACGCEVFSSVNHGLSDFLDPGFNCHKIAGYSLEYDLQRIASVLERSPSPSDRLSESLLAEYRSENLITRLKVILAEINSFFDYLPQYSDNLPKMTQKRLNKLKIKRIYSKIKQKIKI
ncbi:glycosyltransferase [Waterburya agarophytonicola K14]|uniref:Glycosyltransferase n=1 Tax=Waterburya agarophytonicola KI4 TaxID=2874699 RepID=A0A964BTF4_9CYAN|nr:glycosyltransferase [Waterburya agarophytonicola]MCC0179343.1 glycosyltransferase [Waterburya agarophytonicola KI4]